MRLFVFTLLFNILGASMITIRKGDDRGSADHGWLKTRYTFSFAGYHDPNHMGYHALRVINDDRIAPEGGFPDHSHKNMEILTYIIEGAVAHKDSMGNGSVIHKHEVQRMSAGRGVIHSEYNPSKTEETHLLQIWLLPSRRNIDPGYEQKSFPPEKKRGQFCLIASERGENGSISIASDVNISAALLTGDETARYTFAADRKGWVHIVQGTITMNDQTLHEGDGAAIDGEEALIFTNGQEAEVLLFDMNPI